MSNDRKLLKQVLGGVVGAAALIMIAFSLFASPTQAAPSLGAGLNPQETSTAQVCWWCTPRPTRTPCVGCPTPTPLVCWWCTPHPTRTPCVGCPTPTPLVCWWCTPHPTRTPCVGCPTPTAGPCWWCWTPQPTRTPCVGCPTPTPQVCWWCTPHPTRTPCVGCPSPTPHPTYPPAPIALRPWVQFGHADPGSSAVYHKWLLNRVLTDTLVTLNGSSHEGWSVTVNPTSVTVQPGISETISITVGVPLSPTHSCDIERVTASIGGTQPYTATSYLVTIAERHEFADVHAGDWADNYVQYLYSQGAVSGYADGTFRPYDYVTRSQFAKMLVNVMGWQIETPANPTFSDVASDNWAYGYVETAYAHGVISGYADGSFHPLATVTRAQVSKMISTANNWTMEMPYNSSFSDVLTSDWFFGYAEMSRSAQVLGGYADGSFQPNAPATRAQIAKILTLSLYSNPSDY